MDRDYRCSLCLRIAQRDVSTLLPLRFKSCLLERFDEFLRPHARQSRKHTYAMTCVLTMTANGPQRRRFAGSEAGKKRQPQERQHSDGAAGTRDRLQPPRPVKRQPQEHTVPPAARGGCLAPCERCCRLQLASRDAGPTASGEGLNIPARQGWRRLLPARSGGHRVPPAPSRRALKTRKETMSDISRSPVLKP
jgi:hypothetical protein